MTDEAPKPRLPTTDVIEAVRQLLPSDFRAEVHEIADSPNVFVKIYTLDHETYVQFDAEQRELMSGFRDAVAPAIAEIVTSLRRLAPKPAPPTSDMVVHPTPSPSPIPDPTPEPPAD